MEPRAWIEMCWYADPGTTYGPKAVEGLVGTEMTLNDPRVPGGIPCRVLSATVADDGQSVRMRFEPLDDSLDFLDSPVRLPSTPPQKPR